MNYIPTQIVAALAALLLCSGGAQAADSGSPEFSFNGFGTLGAVHSSERNADVVGNFYQLDGAGYTHAWSWDVDSNLGVQMNARFNDQLSAVLQVVSQYRHDGTYTPQIEWANVKYQFTPEFSMRLGRTVATAFMQTDTRLVGYTYLWVRTPQELYGSFPVTNKDGIDATYRSYFGGITNTVQTSYGQITQYPPGGSKVKGSRIFDLNNTLEYGPTTIRVAYTSLQAELRVSAINALFDGFRQFGNVLSGIPGLESTGAQSLALANKYQLRFGYSMATLGVNYDPGAWLLMGEWSKANATGSIGDSTAWYVTGGYRIEKFTPYVTFSQMTVAKPSIPGISTAALCPGPFCATATVLNGGINVVINQLATEQKTVSLGVRWDFMKNTALKLQYDRLTTYPNSTGRLANVQPGFQPGHPVKLFSAAVDFVF